MSNVTVTCSNADEMRLTVKTDLTIGQWKLVLQRVEEAKPFWALDEWRRAIRDAIDAFQDKTVNNIQIPDGAR